MRDDQRITPDACAEAMKRCEERRKDFSHSRIRLYTAAVATGAAVLPADSGALAFSYGLGDTMGAAFGGDPTAKAAAATAAGVANGSDTDLVTAKESDGDFYIESFGLLVNPNSDANLARLILPELFLDVQFDGKTVKRIPGLLAPGGGGMVGAGASYTAASAALQTIPTGASNGEADPHKVFSWGAAPMLWRGINTQDKLTVKVSVPRSVSVPSGGTAALLFDALIVARGVRVKDVAFERS